MDKLTPEERSKVMSAVKSKGTKLERRFFEALEAQSIEGMERHPEDLLGHPDLVHRSSRIVVFIDSCFWHGCPEHLRMPQSNQEYWTKKIARNRKRDRQVTKALREQGWRVLRIWEHSIKKQRSFRWWLSRINTLIDECDETASCGNEN